MDKPVSCTVKPSDSSIDGQANSKLLDEFHGTSGAEKLNAPGAANPCPQSELGKLIDAGKLPAVTVDSPPEHVEPPAITRALYDLYYDSMDSKTPDAIVVIPPNIDQTKPIDLVIYNHGWTDTATTSVKHALLEEQMKHAPQNTVLIVPEWQEKPGAGGPGASAEGDFNDQNFVSTLVQKVFDYTPELKGKTLADVGIISHSAGYVPTESELYKNPDLVSKVNSVTLLDSLYDEHGLDSWIHQNIADLSKGTKRYQNVFNVTTAEYSREQTWFVADELQAYNHSQTRGAELIDYSTEILSAETIKKHPIVFKGTAMPHMDIPTQYVAVIEEAAKR